MINPLLQSLDQVHFNIFDYSLYNNVVKSGKCSQSKIKVLVCYKKKWSLKLA